MAQALPLAVPCPVVPAGQFACLALQRSLSSGHWRLALAMLWFACCPEGVGGPCVPDASCDLTPACKTHTHTHTHTHTSQSFHARRVSDVLQRRHARCVQGRHRCVTAAMYCATDTTTVVAANTTHQCRFEPSQLLRSQCLGSQLVACKRTRQHTC